MARKRVKRIRNLQVKIPDCKTCNKQCTHKCPYIIFESNKASLLKVWGEIDTCSDENDSL